MPKNILVPIDLAQKEIGADALAFARTLGAAQNAEITLLYVASHIPDYVAAQLPAEIAENYDKVAVGDLLSFADDHGGREGIGIQVRSGHPAREILEYAKNHKVDMIAIASHDPGWEDLLLGSVAANVVRHAHCSVLVVREHVNK